MLLRSLSFTFTFLVATLTLTGCTETRSEATATIDGIVTYNGEAVPVGSRLVLEDLSKGIRQTFTVEGEGKFSVGDTSQLPAGTYNVAVLPPATAGPSEAEYEATMNNTTVAASKPEVDDFPVPAEMRVPAKSGKSVTVASGSQTLKIDL